MGADPNVFQAYLQPPKSVLDYQNQYVQADQLKNQNALSSLLLQQKSAEVGQAATAQNALQSIASRWNAQTSADQRVADLRNSGIPQLMTQADALETQGLARTKTEADAAKANADAGKTTTETGVIRHQQHLQALSTVNTPEDAMNWIVSGVQSGALPKEGLAQALQRLQVASSTPDGLSQWKAQTQQSGQTIQQQMEMTTPKPTEMRLGNLVKTIDMNPHSATFGKEVVGQQAVGVSPDTAYTQQHEDNRSAANRAAENVRAGIGPDGKPAGDVDTTARAIADGRLPPPSGMALTNPKNQRILSRVMELNPDYDYTTVTAKKAAATAFTSGQQGNALRSVSTANEHLSQLDQLGDALQNGNVPIVNTIANAYGVQTGQAPAKVFNAVKNVVAQEVVKAIVAGGGSAGERDEAAHAFADASSPAQLKQTITAYRAVMQAQADNLLAQRRAAGLPDSTLPGYNGGVPGAPAGVPPDIQAIIDRHGAK